METTKKKQYEHTKNCHKCLIVVTKVIEKYAVGGYQYAGEGGVRRGGMAGVWGLRLDASYCEL